MSHLDIIAAHVNVVGSQVEVCSRNSAHAPFGLASKGVALVVTRCARDYLVTVLVYGACSGCSQLKLIYLRFTKFERYFQKKTSTEKKIQLKCFLKI